MRWIMGLAIVSVVVIGCGKKETETAAPAEQKVEKESLDAAAKGKKALMVIAQQDFRDEELFTPKEALTKAGVSVTVAGAAKGSATGMLGGTADVELALADAKVDDYDAIIFVGGTGAQTFFEDETALQLAKDAVAKGKVVGAICIAPSILANAGVLKGKKATCYQSESDNLKSKGAECAADPVVQDGKIITADGPESAGPFGQKLIEALAGK